MIHLRSHQVGVHGAETGLLRHHQVDAIRGSRRAQPPLFLALRDGKLDFRLEGEAQFARLVVVETPLGAEKRIAPAVFHRRRSGRNDSLIAQADIKIERITDPARKHQRHFMRDLPRAGYLVDRPVVGRFDLVAAGALRAGIIGHQRLERRGNGRQQEKRCEGPTGAGRR
jgi:hypothetical protein